MSWTNRYDGGPHEAGFLKLGLLETQAGIGWRPRWSIADAVEAHYRMDFVVWQRGGDVAACMSEQISALRGKQNVCSERLLIMFEGMTEQEARKQNTRRRSRVVLRPLSQ